MTVELTDRVLNLAAAMIGHQARQLVERARDRHSCRAGARFADERGDLLVAEAELIARSPPSRSTLPRLRERALVAAEGLLPDRVLEGRGCGVGSAVEISSSGGRRPARRTSSWCD